MSQVLERFPDMLGGGRKDSNKFAGITDHADFLSRAAKEWIQHWNFPEVSSPFNLGIYTITNPLRTAESYLRETYDPLLTHPHFKEKRLQITGEIQLIYDYLNANNIPSTSLVLEIHIPPRPPAVDSSRKFGSVYHHFEASLARVTGWATAWNLIQPPDNKIGTLMGRSLLAVPHLVRRHGIDIVTKSDIIPSGDPREDLIEVVAVNKLKETEDITQLIQRPVYFIITTPQSLQEKFDVNNIEQNGFTVGGIRVDVPKEENDWTMTIGKNNNKEIKRRDIEVLWGVIRLYWRYANDMARDLRIRLKEFDSLTIFYPPADIKDDPQYSHLNIRPSNLLHYMGLPIISYHSPNYAFVQEVVRNVERPLR